MKAKKILSMITLLALFAGSRAVFADQANGTYSVDAGSDVPLWDLSGYYDSDVGIGGLEFTLTHEPSGTLTGTGDLYVSDVLDIDLAAVVSGKVSGSSTDPKVSLKCLATDSQDDEYPVYINYLDVTLSLAMVIDTANDAIDGDGSGTIKYSLVNESTGQSEKGSRSVRTGSVSFPLPDDVTGDWSLTLNLTPDGEKYTGTAEVVTSVGDTVDFTATGTYSTKKDTSDITLKGTGWGGGTSLSLVISTSGSAITINSLSGKLFGQSLKYKAP